MASLQRTTMLARACRLQRLPVVQRRFESTATTNTPSPSERGAGRPAPSTDDAPGFKPGQASTWGLERQEGPMEGQPRHKPDYEVQADYRVSNFSPIPQRVMDGSEPGVDTPAAVLSGAPMDLQARTVRIYRPAKTATQSGDWHSHHWRMDWDVLAKGHRWENPLMGWQSSADFMQGTHLNFQTKEDAINFANKQGYEYFVQEPNERKIVPKAYAAQFLHVKKMKQVRTK